MKKIIYLLLVTLITGHISSCKDMDSVYEEFLVPNGLKYPQRPDSLKVFAGYNRLRLTWLGAKDPSITHAVVYWNNYLDSLKVDIDNDKDTLVVDVDNLGENTYTFYVKTFDKQGNASIPSEVTGTAYGDNYLMAATDRTIVSALRDENKNGTIVWGNKTSDLVYSEVRYTAISGETRTVRILPDESDLICPDIKPGELFEYRSVFLPPNGIDPAGREWVEFEKPFMYKYPRSGWSIEARNGNHAWNDGGGGQPALILDGNIATGWHSRTGTPLPQCVVVDMKESLEITHLIIYPPTTVGWRYLNNMEVYISDTPITPDAPQPSWGEPAAQVRYSGGESFTINFPAPITGQFLAIVFLDSTTSTYISFMELEVFG
ncbi:MAG: discoidin domain-containing protein, partial [Tannerella sp.]|nr:discoidin domain-containing protein [Tannerella sp.]